MSNDDSTVVVVEDDPGLVEVLLTNTEIITVNDNIPGLKGDKGDKGDAGKDADGVSLSEVTETHYQNVTASQWVLTYSMPYLPTVTVVDSAGTVVEGEVQYLPGNVIHILFAVPFSGTAYLS